MNRVLCITRNVNGAMMEYKQKGFKINRLNRTATHNNYIVYIVLFDNYKDKIRGLLFDDIIGCYDDDDLMRLKSYRGL